MIETWIKGTLLVLLLFTSGVFCCKPTKVPNKCEKNMFHLKQGVVFPISWNKNGIRDECNWTVNVDSDCLPEFTCASFTMPPSKGK